MEGSLVTLTKGNTIYYHTYKTFGGNMPLKVCKMHHNAYNMI